MGGQNVRVFKTEDDPRMPRSSPVRGRGRCPLPHDPCVGPFPCNIKFSFTDIALIFSVPYFQPNKMAYPY